MLIISVFIFFITIFAFLYNQYPLHNEQIYTKDLITSLAAFARTNGYLPSSNHDKIPFESIGISSSFFNLPYKKQYTTESEYTNCSLVQYDSLYWCFENFSINRDIQYKNANKIQPKSIIDIKPNHACTLYLKIAQINFPIIINKQMLLSYAQFREFYLHIPFYDLERSYWQQYAKQNNIRFTDYYRSFYTVYPNFKSIIIGYLI